MFLLWVYILLKNHHTNHKCNNNHDDHYDKNGINHSAKARGGGGAGKKYMQLSNFEIRNILPETRS